MSLTQERQDEIAFIAKNLKQNDQITIEKALVDLQAYVEILRKRNENMSEMVQRMLGTLSRLGLALEEIASSSDSTNDQVSITVEWLITLFSALSDPTGKTPISDLKGHIRVDAPDLF